MQKQIDESSKETLDGEVINFTHTDHCNHLQKLRETQGYSHYGLKGEECDCSCHPDYEANKPIDSV